MDKYLVFDTEQEAMAYSHDKAVAMRCGTGSHPVQYWYSWVRTIDGKWAIQCPEGTEEPEFEEAQ